MAISDFDFQRVAEAIKARNPDFNCSVCGTEEFSMADGLFALVLSEKPGVVALSGRTIPCFVVSCSHCGNTLFFNAIALGLQDMVLPKTESQQEAKEGS